METFKVQIRIDALIIQLQYMKSKFFSFSSHFFGDLPIPNSMKYFVNNDRRYDSIIKGNEKEVART